MEHKSWIKRSILSIAVATSIGLTACSSGSGGDPTTSTSNTGVFLDSAVDGINYTTTTLSGTTNANGEFQYNDGETITFSIGDIDLPPATAGSVITPLDLVNTQNLNDTSVINIARLLQSLDTDGDPTNGISISATAHLSATGITVDFSSPTFDNDVVNLVANSGSVTTALIDEATAVSHLQDTLADSGLLTLVGSWYLDADNNTVITFIDESTYFVAQDVLFDPLCSDGMETGTYTWDSATNNFSLTNIVDTTGDCGLTAAQGETYTPNSVSISGNTLTFSDSEGDFSLTKVIDSNNPLIGGWYISGENNTVITFIDATQYYVVQDVAPNQNPPCTDGMEFGLYTSNTSLGTITLDFTNARDTTGDCGLTAAESDTWFATATINGDKLTLSDALEGPFTLDAVR